MVLLLTYFRNGLQYELLITWNDKEFIFAVDKMT